MDQKSKFNHKGRGGLTNETNSRGSYDDQGRKKYNREEENYFDGTGNQKTKKNRKIRPPESTVQQTKVPPGFSISTGFSGPPAVNAWAQKSGSALFTKPQDEVVVDDEDEMLKKVLQESLKTAAKENEKRQHFERFRLPVQAPPQPLQAPPPPLPAKKNNIHSEDCWEDAFDEEEYPESPTVPEEQFQKPDLQFISTESLDECPTFNQKRMIPPRLRKPSRPQRMIPPPPVVNMSFCSPEPPSSSEIFHQPSGPAKNVYNDFEPSRPVEKLHSPPVLNYHNVEISQAPTSYGKQISSLETNIEIVSPERDNINSSVSDISANLKTSLRFGDTQDVFEQIQGNANYRSSTPENQSYQFEPSDDYLLNESNSSVQMPQYKSIPSLDPALYPADVSETDIILHNFIRHEPPSSHVSKAAPPAQNTHPLSDTFSVNNPQHYSESTQIDKHHPTLNGNSRTISINSSGQDSRSSLASNSPIQNVSPYGSFENHTIPNHTKQIHQNSQVQLPFSMNVQGTEGSTNNLQELQLRNQNIAPQLTCSNVPPGYVPPSSCGLPGMVPLNSQLPGVPQYRLPNSNMMLPVLPTPELLNASPHLIQAAQMQQLMAMNVAAMYQLQQTRAQLAALNASETLEPSQKEQASAVIHPQINHQNQMQEQSAQMQMNQQIIKNQIQTQTIQPQIHPHMGQVPNKPQVVPLQNQHNMFQNQPHIMPQNQTHMLSMQNQQRNLPPQIRGMMFQQNHPQATAIQDHFPKDYQQQMSSQKSVENDDEQISLSGKENLEQEYMQTIQKLQQLHQALGTPQIQTPSSMPFPPPQHQFMFPQHPVAVGLNHFYPGVGVMHPAQQQHSNVMPDDNQPSDDEENFPNSPGLNIAPEPNIVYPSLEPRVGRGRGRRQ